MTYDTCPSCGLEKELVPCNKCEYSDDNNTQQYRELLNTVTDTKAGFNAYIVDNGCFTCKPCKELWNEAGYYCSTRLFYSDSLLRTLIDNYEENQEHGFGMATKMGILEMHSFSWVHSSDNIISYRKKLYNNTIDRFVNKLKEDESLKEIKGVILKDGVPRMLRKI